MPIVDADSSDGPLMFIKSYRFLMMPTLKITEKYHDITLMQCQNFKRYDVMDKNPNEGIALFGICSLF